MDFLNWVQNSGFISPQNFGVTAGLFFTGISLLIDAKARRVANHLEITKQHREIWTLLFSNPELERVLDTSADIRQEPVSRREKTFVKLLILHLASARRAGSAGMVSTPTGLRIDIRSFLSLPIPQATWEELKAFQDQSFVRFIEKNR